MKCENIDTDKPLTHDHLPHSKWTRWVHSTNWDFNCLNRLIHVNRAVDTTRLGRQTLEQYCSAQTWTTLMVGLSGAAGVGYLEQLDTMGCTVQSAFLQTVIYWDFFSGTYNQERVTTDVLKGKGDRRRECKQRTRTSTLWSISTCFFLISLFPSCPGHVCSIELSSHVKRLWGWILAV